MSYRTIDNLIIASIAILMMACLISACKYNEERKINVASQKIDKDALEEIIVGAERLALYYSELKDKNVACVVNHTSRVNDKHLVDTLLNLDLKVMKVFAPEHGFRGDVPDGEKIADDTDPRTGIPIVSLYGKKKKPDPTDLENIDVVVFDIQDVGARFYTYLSTLHNIMEACAEQNIKCIVLDRPNPNGHYVDGPVLEEGEKSFVGMHPVPIVYGMTIGEYAMMINGERWLSGGIKCDLEVVQLKNYSRDSYYEIPIPPSPNLPNQRAIMLYPSLCFLEGTTVSIGRGTDNQFQVIGHPGLESSEFSFTPMPNKGSKYPKNEGKLCYGEDLTSLTIGGIIDKGEIDLSYLVDYHQKIIEKESPFFNENGHFNRIAGTPSLKEQLKSGLTIKEIKASWQEGLVEFKKTREKYLIYP